MKSPFNILNGTIFVILFSIVGLIVLIIFSQSLDFGLVQDDYYEQDLKYQKQIERIERTNALPESVKILLVNDVLLVDFPELFQANEVGGSIHLFRPSDPNLDQKISLELLNDGTQEIDVTQLLKGSWLVKLNWSHKDLEYYMEKRIFLTNE